MLGEVVYVDVVGRISQDNFPYTEIKRFGESPSARKISLYPVHSMLLKVSEEAN